VVQQAPVEHHPGEHDMAERAAGAHVPPDRFQSLAERHKAPPCLVRSKAVDVSSGAHGDEIAAQFLARAPN
jgi:hypothetical protein